MAVQLSAPNAEDLLPVKGVRLASHYCGIRKAERDDLVLLELAEGSAVAAVFTRNAFCAAPVQVAREHRRNQPTRFLLINAGNANAGTGQRGLESARASCAAVAEAAGVDAAAVLPFSTGVIGEYLPTDKIQQAVPTLLSHLQASHWLQAAEGITTTDTVAKAASQQVELTDGRQVHITGMAKGAGMLCPDMATMLAYVATDAPIDQERLQTLLQQLADDSFNSITVDGDTSTNDACVLVATGQVGGDTIAADSPDEEKLLTALRTVFLTLAQACIRDGEGAQKFVELRIDRARDRQEARQLAYAIAHSPLVKTALFASDPNWGRILAVVGRAGLVDLQLDQVDIDLNGVAIVRSGERADDYTEAMGQGAMDASELIIQVALGRGDASTSVWTCDFGYDYVRINAEYRT